ncbi:hypothetical protein GCM10018775_44030 [Streptomyces umbrinus]|nr:hypothetical protein GCM10018775_44030 [Streptomyces umbrinus]
MPGMESPSASGSDQKRDTGAGPADRAEGHGRGGQRRDVRIRRPWPSERMAANYCVDNFNNCVVDARAYGRGNLIEGFVAELVTGGKAATRGVKGVAGTCRCFLAGTNILMAGAGGLSAYQDVAGRFMLGGLGGDLV